LTRINSRAIEIKLGDIWIPISRGDMNIRREGHEVYSFSGPAHFIPTQEIIDWRAEFFVTHEFLEADATHWFDNLMQLITRPEPIDCEIRLAEGINISLHGPIEIEISEDIERDCRKVKLMGSGVRPPSSDARFEGFAGQIISESFFNPAFTDTGLGAAIHEQATELLCMFLEPEQAAEFKDKGRFDYIDEENRTWRFIRRYHWPIELWTDGKLQRKLCLDIDPEAPTEDLLLWAYLQVKGGRGEGILKTAKGG